MASFLLLPLRGADDAQCDADCLARDFDRLVRVNNNNLLGAIMRTDFDPVPTTPSPVLSLALILTLTLILILILARNIVVPGPLSIRI